jgi:hypothetical protein
VETFTKALSSPQWPESKWIFCCNNEKKHLYLDVFALKQMFTTETSIWVVRTWSNKVCIY